MVGINSDLHLERGKIRNSIFAAPISRCTFDQNFLKMNKNLWRGLLFSLILVGVQLVYKKYQYSNLEKDTEVIHDEAMKNMAEMNRFGRKIKQELVLADSIGIRPGRRDSLENLLQRISTAENDMMSWMTNYKSESPLLPMKDELEYIRDQKSKIEKNAFDIREAVEAGKNLVK